MLLQTTTSDKIQVVTGQAVTVDVHASAIDIDNSTGAVTFYRLNSAIVTAATTDVVAAPASGKTRNLKTLHVRNKHASSAVDVTVQHTDGTTVVTLWSGNLSAGESVEYVEGVGWKAYDNTGAELVSTSAAMIKVAKLAGDQSNSTVTPTAVAGLTLATGVGTFVFEYFLILQSAATTTGHRLSVNHTGTVTTFTAYLMWGAGSAASADALDQDFVVAGAQITSQFAARAKSTAGWGTTTAVDTANADVLYLVTGIMVVSVDGNIELWHGSEVAAASTVKAGSGLRLTRIGG